MKRTLIVDDEPLARKDLRELLAAHPEIEIVGEAGSAVEALALFRKFQPDLIFLDVQMPKKDGFALLPDLVPAPDIIFVTAYDCFAVKAFEVNAVDFLVKPILPERLALALSRLSHPQQRKVGRFAENGHVILYSDLGARVVIATDITHIQAEGNYSRVHIANKNSMFIRRSLGEWQAQLPASVFTKVDRSNILNLRAVREMAPLPHYRTEVGFDGSPARLALGLFASRRLRKAIRRIAIKA
jgi:two-component system LytT family response regulator